MKTIYQTMLESNQKIENHCSDLYVKVTPEATEILNEFKKQGHHKMTSQFMDNIDNELWYDIPLSFDPYWTKRGLT